MLRNWLTLLCGLASVKSAGQASRLETQGRADIAVWSRRQVCRQDSSFFTLRGCPSFLLKPSTDWMRSTHTIQGDLHDSKPTDLNVHHIRKYLHNNI